MSIAAWHFLFLGATCGALALVLASDRYARWVRGKTLLLYLPLTGAYLVAGIGFVATAIAYLVESASAPDLLIGSLAISATVLAITAGLGEVREALPRQRLNVEVVRGEWFASGPPDVDVAHIEFTNPDNAPLINAYRLGVTLIDADTHEEIQEPPEPESNALGWGGTPLLNITNPGLTPPVWIRDRGPSGERDLYSWTREEEQRWFPGTRLGAPSAPTSVTGHRRLQWSVRWTTDRSAPTDILLDVP